MFESLVGQEPALDLIHFYAGTNTLIALLSVCTACRAQRKNFWHNKLMLHFDSQIELEKNATMEHKNVLLICDFYEYTDETGFGPITCIMSNKFNKTVSDFGRIQYFQCPNFNRLVNDFQNVSAWCCAKFNKPIKSLQNVAYFVCVDFNQPIEDFGNNVYFSSNWFNQPIEKFGDKMNTFVCRSFNQHIVHCGFNNLTKFECASFNQPIREFGPKLQTFICKNFNQPIQNFGRLKEFRSDRFNQFLNSFDNLVIFDCCSFDQRYNLPITHVDLPRKYYCKHFPRQ